MNKAITRKGTIKVILTKRYFADYGFFYSKSKYIWQDLVISISLIQLKINRNNSISIYHFYI